MKEASARIKINKLLEAAGWRFFDEDGRPANIILESGVKITRQDMDAVGENFERISKGYIDFLLLNERGFPFIVLEAKAEGKHPLVGKEQARTYAISQNCRFVILSNGNMHFFWDLQHGNPELVTSFPTPSSMIGYQRVQRDSRKLVDELVDADYIALTQRPTYASDAGWKNIEEREQYAKLNKLRFLRQYQLDAIHAIQKTVAEGKERFLLEMATGTGKTLTAAAIIKLFLRTGNAGRVLFLVDRLELETQAQKDISAALANDYKTVIYKESRDDWRRAEVVVTTVQSLLFNNKYQQLFSPTDFDLVISDEAHRSIGGNARAVFNYFVGYKLGLTATPRDYLKRTKDAEPSPSDPRDAERRLMLDTYRTFGCDSGQPTFRYSLLEGVRDGYLISPIVIDARSEITTALLSSEGYVVPVSEDTSEDEVEAFRQRHFEKRFFSEATNAVFCKTFLENALLDPISSEIGKSIIFAVSQHHAAKLTQMFNKMVDAMYPGKYSSDFAVQVTSLIPDAQQFTINFKNNKLLGSANVLPQYMTSKARVCVTVGMMTTGYDCPDILNIGLFRPIFSPTDFIQIKGRGTRKHNFTDDLHDVKLKYEVGDQMKTAFKLFDFFANCEYFEEDFNYDEELKLPKPSPRSIDPLQPIPPGGDFQYSGADGITAIREIPIGIEGMKIDRMFFGSFENTVRTHDQIVRAVQAGQWDVAIDYLNREILGKPDQYYTVEKLQRAAGVDRKITIREILEKIFGLIPGFKNSDQVLEEEFSKFIADLKPEESEDLPAMKTYFKAYATSERTRKIIASGQLTDLATNPEFTTSDYSAVPSKYRQIIPVYINDYVPLRQFVT